MKFKYYGLILFFFAGLLSFVTSSRGEGRPVVTIGSKQFTENYLLAEIFSLKLEANGYRVIRKFGLGGTMVCWRALTGGQLDMYPEYSGTLKKAVYHGLGEMSDLELKERLNRDGLIFLDGFGFENAYGFGIAKEKAKRLGLRSISDLAKESSLRYGMNHEFMKRADGWNAVASVYGIRQSPTVMHHALLYDALAKGNVDVINVFTTDGEIDRFHLEVMEDDRHFFPDYSAAMLIRGDLDSQLRSLLGFASGTLDAEQMRRLNRIAQDEGYEKAARIYFQEHPGSIRSGFLDKNEPGRSLLEMTLEHLTLTTVSVLAAVFTAFPFAVFMRRYPLFANPVLYFSGLLQTIPSIALLAFMIPILGIGVKPALVALFLYALLPVLRNTYAALNALDPFLLQTADSLGMTKQQKLIMVEIPLALPGMLAGIRTATVINTGTTTLAAFIGAGGLGEPIVSGLALNDPWLILQGAIPAAGLAVGFELLFEWIEFLFIPAHLRKQKS